MIRKNDYSADAKKDLKYSLENGVYKATANIHDSLEEEKRLTPKYIEKFVGSVIKVLLFTIIQVKKLLINY